MFLFGTRLTPAAQLCNITSLTSLLLLIDILGKSTRVSEEVCQYLPQCSYCVAYACAARQWNNRNDNQAHAVPDVTEGQDVLTKRDQHPGPGICANDHPWPVTNYCNTDSIAPYQSPSPYDAHMMTDSMTIPCWMANEYVPKKVSVVNYNTVSWLI